MSADRAYLNQRASQEKARAAECPPDSSTYECHRKMAAVYAAAASTPQRRSPLDEQPAGRLPSSPEILVFGNLAAGSAARQRGDK